jgi:hypothetical protein
MSPSIRDGMKVQIERRAFYWPGDVLLLHAHAPARFVVHRLLGYGFSRRGLVVLTQGDNTATVDPLTPVEYIVGRVVARAPGARDAAFCGPNLRFKAALRYAQIGFRWFLRRCKNVW